jgi:hypothetical protein
MTKIIITIALFISGLVSAQEKFEQEMGKAFQLWDEGKIPKHRQFSKQLL